MQLKKEFKIIMGQKIYRGFMLITFLAILFICYLYKIDLDENIVRSDINFLNFCGKCCPVLSGMFVSLFLGNEYDEDTINQRIIFVGKKVFFCKKMLFCITFSVCLCVMLAILQICISEQATVEIVLLLFALFVWCVIDEFIVFLIILYMKSSMAGYVIAIVLFFYNQSVFVEYSLGRLYGYLIENMLL